MTDIFRYDRGKITAVAKGGGLPRLGGVASPKDDNDVATLAWVKKEVLSGDFVPIGGTVSGKEMTGILKSSSSFQVNTINKFDGSSGVAIEGVKLKDGDVILSDAKVIKAASGGGELNLRNGANNTVSLSTDGSTFAEAWLWFTPKKAQIIFETWGFTTREDANTVATEIGIVVTKNVSFDAKSKNVDNYAIFVGTRNSTINLGVINSVVIGGSGITASVNNTVYIPDLNIQDGKNIVLDTTNGTKIGTGVTQKLSFWDSAPVVQPKNTLQGVITDNSGGSGTDIPAISGSGADANINKAHFAIYGLLNEMRTALVSTGLMKGAA